MGGASSVRRLWRLLLLLLLLLLPLVCVSPNVLTVQSCNFEDCSSAVTGCLPCEEVAAAQNLLNALGVGAQQSVDRDFCTNLDSTVQNFVIFRCNCSIDGQCHIISITKSTVQLSGTIPAIVSRFTYLTSLDLSFNLLNGSIPDSLGNLSNLRTLNLQNNQLTGQIPPSLGRLTKLSYLNLGYNYLNGTINESLGNLSSLETLFLSYNNLHGVIPPHLGNLTNLTGLALTENQLSGSLPNTLGNLTNLQKLFLTSNNFTGEIPKSYGKLTSLRNFDVAGNYLKGPIPSFISKWTNLFSLILFGNEFNEITQEIFNMPNLTILLISDVNRTRAALPKSISLPKISSLMLRNCSISDSIASIRDLKSLHYLDLSFNNLTGDIPSSLWNLPLKMHLTENQLNGKIPPTLMKPDNLTVVGDFTYNNFMTPDEGTVNNKTYFKPNRTTMDEVIRMQCPKKKSKYHSLFINCGGDEVTAEGRHFQADNSSSNFNVSMGWAYSCAGDFPAEAAKQNVFVQTKVCVPPVANAPLYAQARLCPTSLRYYGFCLHKGTYNVTLHFSETKFVSREDYTILGKRVFDVYIQGERVLKDFNIRENASRSGQNISVLSFPAGVDKSGLLEIHFYWAGKGSYITPTLENGPLVAAIAVTPKFHIGLYPWEIAVIATASALFLLFLLVFVLWWTGVIGDKKLREKSIDIRGKPYTVKQVVQGTKNFSPKMEIGEGSIGIVYKCELPNGGPVVAVKKLSPQSLQRKQQVESEVYTLKQLNHDNILELFGGYSDPTKNLHLLVYEYMEHKSIAHALFDPNSELQLNWASRYNICIGMAKGLEYLHSSRFKIVHQNIKSNNILLDESSNPKISDLGLAKLSKDDKSFSISSTGHVYRAPEYATRNVITDKADVYSFGVVLLEIVSGKKNVDYKDAQEAEFLLDKAFVLQMKRRLMDLVDGRLLSDPTYDRKQVKKVLDLAMMCVDQSYKFRPSMSEVVAVLEDEITMEQLEQQYKQIEPSV